MSLSTRIEALLFAADVPLPLARLCEVLHEEKRPDVEAALKSLAESYEADERAFTLVQVAGGWQLATKPEHAGTVRRLFTGKRRVRLTKAALESLAIIAYKQPTTRPEIDAIRGVASGGVIETLLERNLVRMAGRSEGVGRPLLYATTPEFLTYLGLNRIDDLPSLAELEAMLAEREAEARAEDEAEMAELALAAQDGAPVEAGEGAEQATEAAPAARLEDKLRALDLPTLEELDAELRDRGQQVDELSARVAAERARESGSGSSGATLEDGDAASELEVPPSDDTAAVEKGGSAPAG
jgi:segregation and condensation protein B